MLNRNLFRNPRNPLEGAATPPSETPNVPDRFMEACPRCKAAVFSDELAASAQVCPRCSHHRRIAPRERIAQLVDPGSFEELDAGLTAPDALAFPGYQKKLDDARAATGEPEGVVTGTARVGGEACALFVMNPFFMMGSMGAAVGEKITRLFELARARRLPVVGFTVSGGARMQEGILSLMQMAKTSGAVRRHGDAGLLYLCVLTDPTTGGVTASFAMEADITLAEPDALIAFAGPRVIEQTIHRKLPEGFQRAEFLLEHGFVDRIADRRTHRELIGSLLRLHGGEANR